MRDTADVQRALDLAERDVEAFTAVTDAYRLPKGTEGEAEQRSRAIAEAVLGASRPPADVVTTAGSVLDLAERLLPLGNRNVVSDVVAAAEAARAAATTARVHLGGIVDADAPDELREACQGSMSSRRVPRR